MKLIIAGGRDFTDYNFLKQEVSIFLSELREPFPEIIAGGARGADSLAIWYAKERGLKYKIIYADWTKHGEAAGPIRNREMAEIGDACICFWDWKSRGTENMIEEAEKQIMKRKFHLKVIRYAH